MLNSKDINDLLPHVRDLAIQLIAIAEDELLIDKLLITSTYRDAEYQNYLYAQGRTRPGAIVTNARAGYSWHNFQLAFDVVPIVGGKAMWDTSTKAGMQLWQDIGAIGEEVGLDWAGHWQSFKEYAHFQHTGGKTMAQLRKEHGL